MGPLDRGPTVGPEKNHKPNEKGRTRSWLGDNLMLMVTLIGVLTGILIGFVLRPYHLGPDVLVLISYPGELFMRLLKLLILPLIIASLIAGSASLNAKMNGKIALRTIIYFGLTSLFNALLGVVLAVIIHPGQPELKQESIDSDEEKRGHSVLDSFLDIGRNLFPDNIVQATFQQAHTAYVEPSGLLKRNITDEVPDLVRVVAYRSGTNTLGLVMFCIVFGSILGTIGSKGRVVMEFFQAIFEVVMKMVTGVMWFTPFGVASIIAGKILDVSDVAVVMSQLLWFILTVLIGVLFYQLIVMQLIYFLILKKNPYKFYGALSQPMLTACACASTAAALPLTFRAMESDLRIDPRITRFILPIGSNVNMDGTALFLAISSTFICQMNSIQLGFGDLVTIVLTSTTASLSGTAVPSAAMVLLLVVLAAVDAPTQDVSLLFAVDWLADRIRTSNNMLGDCYAAAVVEHLSHKELTPSNNASMEPLLINGQMKTTSTADIDIESITPNKSVILDQVTIDMHLDVNQRSSHNGHK